MADDIVTRLRVIYCAADDLTPCGTCLTCRAADEIERLRAAGDALALASTLDLCDCSNEDCMALRDAHRTWTEARS